MISQKDMKSIFLPLLQEQGQVFFKKQKIWARKANEGEIVITVTHDGLETSNVANLGDMVVKNQTVAEEMYVMQKTSFEQRYSNLEDADLDQEGFQEFLPIGKINALLIDNQLLKKLNLLDEFYFEAPWKSSMVCKENDYLACPPDFSQVYRIARKEFFETYGNG